MQTRPVKTPGIRFEIARQILLAICRGDIQGGERLTVKRLATDFDVSITPAREALLELANVGAVDLHPNKGAVVRPFGAMQVLEIYDLRRLLEVEAVRLSCGRLPHEPLEALRRETVSLLQSGYSPHLSSRAIRCDRELHELVAVSCGHSYLTHEIGRMTKLITDVRGLLGDVPQIKQAAVKEHLRIIDALIANNPQEAMEAMRVHIQNVCRYLLNEVFPDWRNVVSNSTSCPPLFGESL